ncbi:hypothetical protein BDR26DRAFT_549079 [Obelidium mucronatum]|nr:hypothetical protein BDR26DRAFT_549079 [Obelidium mucronatum]
MWIVLPFSCRSSFCENLRKNLGCVVTIKRCRFRHSGSIKNPFYYIVADEMNYIGGEGNAVIGNPVALNSDEDFCLLVESATLPETEKDADDSHQDRQNEQAGTRKRRQGPSKKSPQLVVRNEPSKKRYRNASAFEPFESKSCASNDNYDTGESASTTKRKKRNSLDDEIDASPVIYQRKSRHFGWGQFELLDETCIIPSDQVLPTHMQVPIPEDPIAFIVIAVHCVCSLFLIVYLR